MRYALKWEVASLDYKRTVFPWSMSDFKPGEKVCTVGDVSKPFELLRRRCVVFLAGLPNGARLESTVLYACYLVFTDPESLNYPTKIEGFRFFSARG